jgi:hypothetical protein
MEYGGMVHALEEIHRLLKPTGALIDIHPVSESLPIEIHQSGKIDLVGDLSVRQWCVDFQQADNALREVVQSGLFAVEQEAVFDSLTYYTSAGEMRTLCENPSINLPEMLSWPTRQCCMPRHWPRGLRN